MADKKIPFEEVIEHAHDMVIITKADNIDPPDGPEIIYVNTAFTKVTGYSPAEVIGKTPRLLQDPKTDRETLAEIRKAIQNGKTYRAELLNYKKDGSEFWLDYMVTPLFNDDGSIGYYCAIERDITENKKIENDLKCLSFIDNLTGAFNRRYLLSYLNVILKHNHRKSNSFGFILIDIDDFKKFNDKEGHLYGDRVLINLVNTCKAVFSDSDLICRIGGDEFAIIMPGATTTVIESKAQELIESLKRLSPPIKISVGGTTLDDCDDKFDDIMMRADRALYEVKLNDKGGLKIH
ncbi:diguanylate cyclase [Legionella sp. PATHC035]|uniref:sensor domain-containing diguanylate cyclase n=1 Tax=Legionella sp. PATHC035 TaxID=2992040 RepID=UPI0022432514|nr:diguanylate cyclase [Legionella sp. PATHC035]MCW8407504.1 diguanylate cyclase [Legionella sp. PATHC035]